MKLLHLLNYILIPLLIVVIGAFAYAAYFDEPWVKPLSIAALVVGISIKFVRSKIKKDTP